MLHYHIYDKQAETALHHAAKCHEFLYAKETKRYVTYGIVSVIKTKLIVSDKSFLKQDTVFLQHLLIIVVDKNLYKTCTTDIAVKAR